MEEDRAIAAGPAATTRRKAPDRLTIGLVTLIVAIGLALRLCGIGWSLPDRRHPLATYHPDELVNLNAALAADIPHGKFDTGFYNYGAFYFYLVSFAQTFGRGWGLIPVTPPWSADSPPPSPVEEMTRAAPEQAALFLAGRLVTALLGTATIVVVFALGSRLYGRKAGLFAALLYAIAPLAVVHAHFLTVDVSATFFVSLALLWAARLLASPTWKEGALAGVWVGLAAATKYSAGLVLIAPLVAPLLSQKPGSRASQCAGQLAVILAAAVLTFLIACPGPWLNFDAFWNGTYPGSGVRYELFEHSRQGHGLLFVNTGPGWWYHLLVSLQFGLGAPLLLLALYSLGFACAQRAKQDRVLLAYLCLYYILTSLSAVRFARYMLPLFPVLCVLTARAVTAPYSRQAAARVCLAAGMLAALLTAGYTFSLVRAMVRRDPRDAAADYLEREAPQRASVAFATIPWFYSPPLSPLFGALRSDVRARAAEQTTRFQLRIPHPDWDTGVLHPPPDYIVLSDIETMHPRLRLHQDAAFRFTDMAIPDSYHVHKFEPDSLFWLADAGPIIPEDLLYIAPTLTVYEKPR